MSDEGEMWTCTACTLKNELIVEACAACGATSPLVLQSYAAEEQGFAEIETEGRRSQRASQISQGSDNATPRGNDDDDDMDPWTQAECEWANVEARQDSRSRK